jgi:hypothetical protein
VIFYDRGMNPAGVGHGGATIVQIDPGHGAAENVVPKWLLSGTK